MTPDLNPITAEVEFTWGGDLRTFRLTIPNCLALEEKCKCGLAEIRERLTSDRWHVVDVVEPLRLGLIGAGVDGKKARELVDTYCGDGQLQKNSLAAFIVVTAAMAAPENEPSVGKAPAPVESREPAIGSPLPSSTGTPPR